MLSGMLRDIVRLASALIRQVAALTTGGLVAAVVTAYEHWMGHALSARAFLYGLIAFAVVAVFRVWEQQQRMVAKLNARIVELQGSEITEAYCEIAIVRVSETAFDVRLVFRRNVAAVYPAPECFPDAHRVIWSEPFASRDYVVDISSAGRSAIEERTGRTADSIVFYFGAHETSVTVAAKGRRAGDRAAS